MQPNKRPANNQTQRWHFPQYRLDNIDDFAIAIMFGIIGAMAGWIFMGIFRGCDAFWQAVSRLRAFALIPGPIYVRTTLAGLGLGSLAVLLPLTRYFGHEELESVLTTNFS